MSTKEALRQRKALRKNEGRRYLVTIAGQLEYKEDNVEKRANYEETVLMDHEQVAEGPVSQFMKHYAPEIFPAKIEGFKRVETHHIVKSVDADDEDAPIEDLNLMNREMLIDYIENEELEIDPSLCEDAESIRQAITDYEDNPEAFLKAQAAKKEKRGADIVLKSKAKELMRLQRESATANKPIEKKAVPSVKKIKNEIKTAKRSKNRTIDLDDE